MHNPVTVKKYIRIEVQIEVVSYSIVFNIESVQKSVQSLFKQIQTISLTFLRRVFL